MSSPANKWDKQLFLDIVVLAKDVTFRCPESAKLLLGEGEKVIDVIREYRFQ